jgi:integrase/recombinase XerD
VAKRRLPKIISAAEADRLLEAAEDGTEVGLRNHLMLELMYRAGLRVSEVCNLQPHHVESAGIIRVYDAKGGDGTAYFDPDRINPLVTCWLGIRQSWGAPSGGYLFIHPNRAGLISTRYVQRLVKRLRAQVGIVSICTPHVLRHTFATELLADGFLLTQVQAALRHQHLQTTAVYLHVRDEELLRKMQQRGRGLQEPPTP